MKPGTVKICGLTRVEDVHGAVGAGADLLGFVHHEDSPRHVSLQDLTSLVAAVPANKSSVLVVVNGDPDDLGSLMKTSGADLLQLCGDQDPEDFESFGFPILRRIGVQKGALVDLVRWFSAAQAFVLDHPSSAGGSGLLVDSVLAAELAAAGPCLLAGGLGPESVATSIRAVKPLGVDASSRLERAPGKKDPQRMTDFADRARQAFALQETQP